MSDNGDDLFKFAVALTQSYVNLWRMTNGLDPVVARPDRPRVREHSDAYPDPSAQNTDTNGD